MVKLVRYTYENTFESEERRRRSPSTSTLSYKAIPTM